MALLMFCAASGTSFAQPVTTAQKALERAIAAGLDANLPNAEVFGRPTAWPAGTTVRQLAAPGARDAGLVTRVPNSSWLLFQDLHSGLFFASGEAVCRQSVGRRRLVLRHGVVADRQRRRQVDIEARPVG